MKRRPSPLACLWFLLLPIAARAGTPFGPILHQSGNVMITEWAGSDDANPADNSYAAFKGGPTIGDLNLQLIFYGAEWQTDEFAPVQQQLIAAAQSVLAGPYLSDMWEYGLHSQNLRGVDNEGSDPATSYDKDAAGQMVWSRIYDGIYPWPTDNGGRILYMVFMPPFHDSNSTGFIGAHGDPWKIKDTGIQYAWVAWVEYGSIDRMTETFTHELVESISNPEPHDNAWLMDKSYNRDGDEIGDACDETSQRLDGIAVQAYWANEFAACIIPYPLPPQITSVSPNRGGPEGGDVVYVAGANFDTHGGTSISFGGVPALGVWCPNSSGCFATTPGGLGPVEVVVKVNIFTTAKNPANDTYGYYPYITSVTPNHGYPGDYVTITGNGVGANTRIWWGQNATTSMDCRNPPGCLVQVPPGSGSVDLVPMDGSVGGYSNPPGSLFSYDGAQITYLSPAAGPRWGGTQFSITGQGFDALGDDGMQILFGSTPATIFWCMTSTQCDGYTPELPGAGSYDVRVQIYGVPSAPAPMQFQARPLPVLSEFFVDTASQTGSVILDGNPPPAGVWVALRSTDERAVHVPGLVQVIGSAGASFPVHFNPSPKDVTVRLTASYNGVTLHQGPYFIGASPPLFIGFADAILSPGAATTGTVQLLHRAPAGGALVHLSASSSDLSIPATVRIPAHHFRASFIAVSNVVADPGGPRQPTPVTVTARYLHLKGTATIGLSHINPPNPCPGPACQ